jgi:hypothetical protein
MPLLNQFKDFKACVIIIRQTSHTIEIERRNNLYIIIQYQGGDESLRFRSKLLVQNGS